MAKILEFIPVDQRVFEPKTTRAMSTAFDQCCEELGILATNRRGREIIALRIITLAREGLTDATALRRRVAEAQSFMQWRAHAGAQQSATQRPERRGSIALSARRNHLRRTPSVSDEP